MSNLKNNTTELNEILNTMNNLPLGGGGLRQIEQMIDESGVLDSTEGTATEKVKQLIDKAEWENVWYGNTETIPIARSTFENFQGKTIPRTNFITATEMHTTFCNASIEYIDYYINSKNATNFQYCFRHCSALKWLVGVNTSKAINVAGIFFGCTKLETIQEPLDFTNVTAIGNAFQATNSLKNITFVKESIKVSCLCGHSSQLAAESIQNIIDGLAYVETAQTLTLNSAIALTDEQKATINSKGWTLAQ